MNLTGGRDMKQGLKKVPTLGTSFGRQQAGFCASPTLDASLTSSSTRASLVWRVSSMMPSHFLDVPQSLFKKKAGF